MDHTMVKEFEEIVEKEIRKIIMKDDLTPVELDNASKALKVLCKMKEYIADDMMEEDYYGGYSQRRAYQRSYDQGQNSYEHGGRSMRSGRLSMNWNNPPYSRTGDYSRHGNNEMIERLESMREEYAGDPESMRVLDSMLEKVR